MAIVTSQIVGSNPAASGVTGNATLKSLSFEYDLSNLTTGFTSGDSVNLFAIPQGAIALGGSVNNITALTGDITRIDLGDAADDDRYVSNFATVTAGAYAPVVSANFPFSYNTSTATDRIVQLKIAATTVASLGGKIQVNIIYVDLQPNVSASTTIPAV